MSELIKTKHNLLKLIKEAEEQFSGTGKALLDIEDYVAEYLTANGVIVPPCKVGDTVYCLHSHILMEYIVLRMSMKSNGVFDFLVMPKGMPEDRSSFSSDEVEKTWFVNYEDAKIAKEKDSENLKKANQERRKKFLDELERRRLMKGGEG